MRRLWIWIRHPWHALAVHLASRRGCLLIRAQEYTALAQRLDYLPGLPMKKRNQCLLEMAGLWRGGIWGPTA
jgi:hypothetical protein